MSATVTTNGAEPDRVRRHTTPAVNRRIDHSLERNIHYFAVQPPALLDERIRALDEEWDIERALETNAASFALAGLLAGLVFTRKWLLLPAVVAGFLLMHGVKGWCPPLPLFRRAGVRTRREIEREKFALKFLRGDFENLEADSELQQARKLRRAVER